MLKKIETKVIKIHSSGNFASISECLQTVRDEWSAHLREMNQEADPPKEKPTPKVHTMRIITQGSFAAKTDTKTSKLHSQLEVCITTHKTIMILVIDALPSFLSFSCMMDRLHFDIIK